MKSFFENPDYEWRETLFVLFDRKTCPPVTRETVRRFFAETEFAFLEIKAAKESADGMLRRLLAVSPETRCGLELVFQEGDAVLEQTREFHRTIQETLDAYESRQWEKIFPLSACFELMYFEKIQKSLRIAGETREEPLLYDPGTLLFVTEKLSQFTHGVVLDPQSGMILEIDN